MINLLRACHPGPTAAVTAIMIALAASAGRGTGTVWVGFAVLAGQLSVGWSNDYLDRGRDRWAGRASKPVAAGTLPPRWILFAALLALAAAVAFSFAAGWRAALAHLAGVAAAWGYNAGLKRTVVSPAPYAVAFGLLPAFVTLGLPGHPWPTWWAMAAGALLGTAAHFTNVLPDMAVDLATEVRGLPQRLGEHPARLTSAAALIVASALLMIAPAATHPGPAGIAAVAAAGATVLALLAFGRRRPGFARIPFVVTVAIAVLDVALLIARGAALH